jgi:hypothetical protein
MEGFFFFCRIPFYFNYFSNIIFSIHQFRISISQFTNALKQISFPIEEDRIDVLYEHYRDIKVPTDVNYLAFIRDIEFDRQVFYLV